MRRLSRWTPLYDQLFHNRYRSKRDRKRRGVTSTDYMVSLVGAMCAMEYEAVRRPNGKFYHGLVGHIRRHRVPA